MKQVVVEIGPITIRGPNEAEPEWVSACIDAIDDELVLVDDRAVPATQVWQRIMQDVVGGSAETVVLVCPTWWSSSRVERVCGAAETVANDVIVLRRAELLSDPQMSFVELAPEFVVIASRGAIVDVVRPDDTDRLLTRIPTSAVLDAPEGVEGDRALIKVLRANDSDVMVTDRGWVGRSVESICSLVDTGHREPQPSVRRSGRAAAVLAGTLVSAAVMCGGFAARHHLPTATADLPMTLLVEGRVGVMVPAQWVVEHITSGPGSARVQVVSPNDATGALHITQSTLAPQQAHEQVADSLRDALAQEPDGVFADFDPTGRRVDRAVVTYREVRRDRQIAWFVLIDRSLRIAIGCQSAPGHEEVMQQVCDRAIASAHAVF
ncbi:type VII secretion-associated protein [Mycobacterium sp. OAE908]|uniref:type VII secretion-associated protein n=1 Tax=Mycobacterium sp. OAE908 TaxID=2817899 RepID=UPI001AE8F926